MKGRIYTLQFTDGAQIKDMHFVLDRYLGVHLSDLAEIVPVRDWRWICDDGKRIVLAQFEVDAFLGESHPMAAASLYEGCPRTLRRELLSLGVIPGWGGYDII